jgi:hypothetical protein
MQLQLRDVAWCPDILCNLVSFRLLKQQGMWWDTKSDPTALKDRDNNTIAHLAEAHGQWILEAQDASNAVFFTRSINSRTKRPAQKADAIRWHKRLGHPGPAALEHLVQQSEGVRIKGITTVQCNACGKAKTKRQVRRTPRVNDQGPGERLAIDFHTYEEGSSTKEKSQMLVTDRYSGFLWDFYFKDNRLGKTIISFLDTMVRFLEQQYNIGVKVIECDGEIATTKPEVSRWCTARSIQLEPSAPDTQAQNGGAERSGGVIKDKARTIRLDANLPWELWPEIVRAAVYLHNRTPNYSNAWKSPYEVFFTTAALHNGIVTSPRKPNQTHLKAYGCKAFALTDDTLRGKSRLQRLDPRAWIGYLVGYRSSNIYRIWIPSMAKVISTRDVVFDEDSVFSGKTEDLMDNLMHSRLNEIAAWMRAVELPEPTHEEPETATFYEDDIVHGSDTTQQDDQPGYYQGRKVDYAYPTPPTTPPPVVLLMQLSLGEHQGGSRAPTGSSRTIPWEAAFMAGAQAGPVGTHDGKIIDKAKMNRMLAQGIKPHQSELPLPPTSHTGLKNHPLCKWFKEAEKEHLESHYKMKSWSEVPLKKIKLTGQQILDCMWVYTYKLNKNHHLLKCKARLVVRGDQQRNITSQDTYAATLASRSFRMLAAIAAHHDLELKQYDVTNAFVHATMDREIYMRMPHGYQKSGTVLKVNKALYGLRISPLLWQKEFTSTLTALGFQSVPHEPCCLIKNGIIIFFYVDDIILAYYKQRESEAQRAIRQLQERYVLTGGDDLQWFLGVEIIRDRSQRKIQLSQAAYANKISRLADKRDVRHDTPMATVELKPREGLATPSEINRYSRKIGSLLFAAVTTRPDIAFATSRLARFLMNPGPAHQDAADRVLVYLLATKSRALELGGGDGFEVTSDASFADNTLDRKSSQGYTIKLFGGLIAWRASKQDTVTTSTTEAELLALSQVAKEAMFTSRLLKELGVHLSESPITIQCDNTQTIQLVTKEASKLQTKLRHVDIHNHWLRQEVSNGTIHVKYIPTAEMLADGFTKALPANKWEEFLRRLGLVQRKDRGSVGSAALEEIQEQIENMLLK